MLLLLLIYVLGCIFLYFVFKGLPMAILIALIAVPIYFAVTHIYAVLAIVFILSIIAIVKGLQNK